MTPGQPGRRSPLEVLFRPENMSEWVWLQAPKNLQTKADSAGRIGFRLECEGLGFKPRDHIGRFFAHLLVLQHYMASSDLKYFPQALLSYHIKLDKTEVEIQASEAPIPTLPQGFAGWEGRNPTHLTFNAKPRELEELVAFLKQWSG